MIFKALTWGVPFLMMLQQKHRTTTRQTPNHLGHFGSEGSPATMQDTLMGVLDSVDLQKVMGVLQKHDSTQLRDVSQVKTKSQEMAQVQTSKIKNIDDRIEKMMRVIEVGKRDPRIRERVAKIVRQVPERNDMAELNAVFTDIREKVRFTNDIHNIELFQDPTTTYNLQIGDCDDYVIALASMLANIGFPVKIKLSADDRDRQNVPLWNHVWLQAGIKSKENPTEWVDVDASVDKPLGWSVDQDKNVAETKEYIL